MGKILLNYEMDGSTLALLGCKSLREYLTKSEEMYREAKRRKPIRSFLCKILYNQSHIQFTIRNLILDEPSKENPFITNPSQESSINWYLLTQNSEELSAFINLRSIFGDLEEEKVIDLMKCSYGDSVNVILSPIKINGEMFPYTEIYRLKKNLNKS